MYVPGHFAETRGEVLHEALRASGPFALMTRDDNGFDAMAQAMARSERPE